MEDGYDLIIKLADLTEDQLVEEYNRTLAATREELEQTNNVLNKLLRSHNYTHAEIDPNAIFGYSASLLPLPDHSAGPRNTFTCGMMKQALGAYHSNHPIRFDNSTKMLAFPEAPIFATQMNKFLNMDNTPSGQNVIIALMSYTGYNQEDAIIFNKSSIERGLFSYVVFRSYVSILSKSDKNFEEYFVYPEVSGSKAEYYKALDQRGIAKIGSFVKAGDVLISKARRSRDTGKVVEYVNVRVGLNEEGIVDRILIDRNEEGSEFVKIKLRETRLGNNPQEGDKYASRYSQKGVIGLVLPAEDMPFTSGGVVPDIIVNPHCIPSRLTVGKLIEIVSSKVGALRGERVNASAFQDFDVHTFERQLTDFGFSSTGEETMYSGFTGRSFKTQIFIGVCFYQALKHQVIDKIQVRSTNHIKNTTHQPVGGRQKGGGIRIGTMENNGLISSGASNLSRDAMCNRSDAYKAVFCTTCGQIAISDVKMGTLACRSCGDKGDFGRCTIPYSMKLFVHFLNGAGLKFTVGLKKK